MRTFDSNFLISRNYLYDSYSSILKKYFSETRQHSRGIGKAYYLRMGMRTNGCLSNKSSNHLQIKVCNALSASCRWGIVVCRHNGPIFSRSILSLFLRPFFLCLISSHPFPIIIQGDGGVTFVWNEDRWKRKEERTVSDYSLRLSSRFPYFPYAGITTSIEPKAYAAIS